MTRVAKMPCCLLSAKHVPSDALAAASVALGDACFLCPLLAVLWSADVAIVEVFPSYVSSGLL